MSLGSFSTLFGRRRLVRTCDARVVFVRHLSLGSIMGIARARYIIIASAVSRGRVLGVLGDSNMGNMSKEFVDHLSVSFGGFGRIYTRGKVRVASFRDRVSFNRFGLGSSKLVPMVIRSCGAGRILVVTCVGRRTFRRAIGAKHVACCDEDEGYR